MKLTKKLSLLVGALKYDRPTVVYLENTRLELSNILGEDISELTNDAILLADKSRYTELHITELQLVLAKLGLNKDQIRDTQKSILDFASSLNETPINAAKIVITSTLAFGASTTETERYVSAMTIAANRTALSFEYLATAMPIVAPVAKAFNFSIEDTLALLGYLADRGFSGLMAARSLRNILQDQEDTPWRKLKESDKIVENIFTSEVTGIEGIRMLLKDIKDENS